MQDFASLIEAGGMPEAVSILAISGHDRLRLDLRRKMTGTRWLLTEASSGAEGLEHLYEQHHDILLLDPVLPDLKASELKMLVQERFPAVQILTVNAQTGRLMLGSTPPTSDIDALDAMISVGRGSEPVETRSPMQLHRMRAPGMERMALPGMIGSCEAMQRVCEMTQRVAGRDTTVLVTGESGTGKDLIAQAIHQLSPRQKQPLVTINCAAIPEALLESELFGYVKGSFTGASQSRIGRIQAAHGGTLFLDEIGDMPLSLQSKILRFLEQGELQRLGSNENERVDVRVVAATHADLKGLAAKGMFREDLYYRLAVFPIKLPPLRERAGDLESLCRALLVKLDRGLSLSDEALDVLTNHHWPGNVRELKNVLERATIMAQGETQIGEEHILL